MKAIVASAIILLACAASSGAWAASPAKKGHASGSSNSSGGHSVAPLAANFAAGKVQFYEWQQGNPPTSMMRVDDGLCVLVSVGGHFFGPGEWVQVQVDDNGVWQLTGDSGQQGVLAWAGCAAWSHFFFANPQSWNWSAAWDMGISASSVVTQDDVLQGWGSLSACFLDGVQGKFSEIAGVLEPAADLIPAQTQYTYPTNPYDQGNWVITARNSQYTTTTFSTWAGCAYTQSSVPGSTVYLPWSVEAAQACTGPNAATECLYSDGSQIATTTTLPDASSALCALTDIQGALSDSTSYMGLSTDASTGSQVVTVSNSSSSFMLRAGVRCLYFNDVGSP
ncbi:MAG: hypothetical protein FWD17_00150 [Polyangiaceae bacterium]|nr:hypothetical protein [Polyangiaceae bacterium]